MRLTTILTLGLSAFTTTTTTMPTDINANPAEAATQTIEDSNNIIQDHNPTTEDTTLTTTARTAETVTFCDNTWFLGACQTVAAPRNLCTNLFVSVKSFKANMEGVDCRLYPEAGCKGANFHVVSKLQPGFVLTDKKGYPHRSFTCSF